MASRPKSRSSRPAGRRTSSGPAPSPRSFSSVRRRRDLLADVTRSLSHVDTLAATLARVARACIPELADKCIVDVMDEDGRVERVEAVHVDASRAEAMAQLKRQPPPREGHPVLEVFETGRPMLLTQVGEDDLARMANDPTHLVLLRRFGPKSLMRLPVTIGGRTVAVITFSMTDATRSLTMPDLRFAEEIIERTVAALDSSTRA
jgi:GAF domain-containing protein